MENKLIDDVLGRLQEEIANLKARCIISDEDMEHLRAISYISFCAWYDPDNDAAEKIGRALEPHISALNKKLHFKR
jgi:hypothetical protein